MHKTAHNIYFATYVKADGSHIKVLYKENKAGNPQVSVYEAAFSELARALMRPHLTPPYHLVTGQKGEILGVAGHHISYCIAKKENLKNTQFMVIEPLGSEYVYKEQKGAAETPEQIPFKFLNELPHGYFAHLMRDLKAGKLDVDMDSLASILVGKYTLEEDDLHKANIGLYVVKKNGKPYVTFFNIDHDLMMIDSISSFHATRVWSWGFDEQSFNITAEDLRRFPDLRDSRNHYWPTRNQVLVTPGDDKVYSNAEERKAFADLRHNKEFNRFKWKRLIKGILMPDKILHAALTRHLDLERSEGSAQMTLITQAVNERAIQLREVLFSMPEFWRYVDSPTGRADIRDVQQELVDFAKDIFPSAHEARLRAWVLKHQEEHLKFLSPKFRNSVQTEDTALHLSIRFGDYRFEQSKKNFGKYLNTPNQQGKRPLDVAAELVRDYEPCSERVNPAQDPLFVMKHLLEQGAKMTPTAKAILSAKGINLQSYSFNSQYYSRSVSNYADLKALITQVGKDEHLSLKTKKIITLTLVKAHVHKLTPKERKQFKEDLNGASRKSIAPEFLFMSQLRSSLWIIRLIRGLYGRSSTRSQLNALLDGGYKHNKKQVELPRFFTPMPKTPNRTPSSKGDSVLVNPDSRRLYSKPSL